jgi:hypothetical protein
MGFAVIFELLAFSLRTQSVRRNLAFCLPLR